MEKNTEGAKRFDQDKIRVDLIPPVLIEEVGKILTMGSKKYGDNNWREGMKWSRCVASLKRHLLAFEKGVDYDEESKELHLSHVIVNSMFLLQYYQDHPELDDRPHKYLQTRRIAIDIDDVIAGFVDGFKVKFNIQRDPTDWRDPQFVDKLSTLKEDKEFWLGLPTLINPIDIPFEPVAYITGRHIDPVITQEWLDKNHFARAPLFTTNGKSKLDICKEQKVDIFVDDNYDTFVELNKGGVCTYLMDRSYNRKFDVGYKRIYSLKELK